MAKHAYSEDLFKDTTMTFGEHLEELRSCLIRAVVGLVIGCGISLYFAQEIVIFIQSPFVEALTEYYKEQARKRYAGLYEQQAEAGIPPEMSPAEVNYLIEHRGLLWRQVSLDPTQLFGAIRREFPGQLDPLRLVGPTRLQPRDLLDPDTVVEALTDPEATAARKRFWERLPPAAQQAIAEADSEADRRAALTALNEVLDDADLYDPQVFAEVPLFAEARYLLDRRGQLTAAEQMRFNRLLLEATFADTAGIAPSYPRLVTLLQWYPIENDERISLKSLNAQEAFMIWLKAGIVAGLILSSPWVFYWIWVFVAAGLYPHEKRYVYIFLPFSLGLFLSGAAFAFLVVFRYVLSFLLGFNEWMNIDPDPRISEWLSFALMLPLMFGISFELPLVMLFLERIGIFDVAAYVSKWRIAVLVIAVVAMILTPSDPMSMMLMALPLWFLYGLGIVLCKYMRRSASPFEVPEAVESR